MIETPPSSSQQALSIAAVERDTGLSKDTLRVWERRYGFPDPRRDAHGERVYPAEQVEKLRLVKRLMDRGLRPGKIIGQPIEELQILAGAPLDADDAELPAEGLDPVLALVKSHQVDALRHELSQLQMRQGMHRFLVETVSRLNQAIGDAWMRGEIEIFEEHLYSEVMVSLLRTSIGAMPRAGRAPRVLLTTVPNEQHALGLLMAEGIFLLEGATCASLGTQTPARDIGPAAASQSAHIVALSFSSAFPTTQVADALAEIRDRLPASVDLWAGGANAALTRRNLPVARVVRHLGDIAPALADWRAAHPGA